MAKKKMGTKGMGGTIHSIQSGLTTDAPPVQDASRVIKSKLSVNDGAVRTGTAVGRTEKTTGGSLK